MESGRIANVYVFSNGMAMVFDTIGEQMPDYQGKWEDVKEKVRRDATEETLYHFPYQWKR